MWAIGVAVLVFALWIYASNKVLAWRHQRLLEEDWAKLPQAVKDAVQNPGVPNATYQPWEPLVTGVTTAYVPEDPPTPQLPWGHP